jgi:hypothetical protein
LVERTRGHHPAIVSDRRFIAIPVDKEEILVFRRSACFVRISDDIALGDLGTVPADTRYRVPTV